MCLLQDLMEKVMILCVFIVGSCGEGDDPMCVYCRILWRR